MTDDLGNTTYLVKALKVFEYRVIAAGTARSWPLLGQALTGAPTASSTVLPGSRLAAIPFS